MFEKEEQQIKNEWKLLTAPNQVLVSLKVSKIGTFYIPSEEGEEEIKAVFKLMSFQDKEIIDSMVMHKTENEESGEMQYNFDIDEMRKLILRRQLISWNLDIPIKRENDWLTDQCFARALKVSAPIMTSILTQYEEHIIMNDDEERKINKQSVVLFSENSRGVSSPCDAVSLYCTLSGFWDKYGMNIDHLNNLSYKQYQQLRIMLSNENGAHKRAQKSKPNHPVHKMGAGGKIVPATGIRMKG